MQQYTIIKRSQSRYMYNIYTPSYAPNVNYLIWTLNSVVLPGCGGTLNATWATFRSLDADADGQYEKNLDCVWRIQAPFRRRISFRLALFQLQPRTGRNCTDLLEVKITIVSANKALSYRVKINRNSLVHSSRNHSSYCNLCVIVY